MAAHISKYSRRVRSRVGQKSHLKRRGAKTRMPSISPSHQVIHVAPVMAEVTTPPSHRLPTPTVAVTDDTRTATRMRPGLSRRRKRGGLKSTYGFRRYAPKSGPAG